MTGFSKKDSKQILDKPISKKLTKSAWRAFKRVVTTNEERAASLLQRTYRKHRQERIKAEKLLNMQILFDRLAEYKRETDRTYWRGVDLNRLSRSQLETIARQLDLKATGKKHEILQQIKHWIDQPALVHESAIHAASRAADKKSQGTCRVVSCRAATETETHRCTLTLKP